MLERFTSQFQSAVLFLIVAMLVIVFSSTFGGPQSQGCQGGARPAVEVDGDNVLRESSSFTDGAFYAAMTLRYGRLSDDEARAADARANTANGIVERVLLAREAARLGIRVTPEQALRQIVRRDEIYITTTVDARGGSRLNAVPFGLRDEDGNVDRERLVGAVENLRRTMGEFQAWQAEEIMAERMRQVVRASVVVAPGEAWDAFVRENEKAMIRYVRFSGSYYADQLLPSNAELDAYVAAHAQAVNDEFAANRAQYQGLEAQVRARQILIRIEESADEATKTAARTRATALLARARAADLAGFAALARAESGDVVSARKGGDLGWTPRGRLPTTVDEALFALQPGQTAVALVESPQGLHILRVDARRQGDVPEQEAKRDIAERLFRVDQGRVLAQRAAAAMLARLKSGTSFDAIAAEIDPPVAEGATPPARDPAAPATATSSEFGPGESPIAELRSGYTVAQAAFALTTENPYPAEPVVAGDDVVIFRLESIRHADRAEYTDEVRARLTGSLRVTKEDDAVETFVRSLRTRAERAGRVHVDPAILRYGDEEQTTEEDGENEAG